MKADGRILQVKTVRDSDNSASMTEMPDVLPLSKLRGCDFMTVFVPFKERLSALMDAQRVAAIESEHVALFRAYREEHVLAAALDAFYSTTTFQQEWSLVSPRFNALRVWAGDVASVIPNTATVESDFSVLEWDKIVSSESDRPGVGGHHAVETVRCARQGRQFWGLRMCE